MGVDSRLLDVMMSKNSAAGEIAYLAPSFMRQLRVTTEFVTTWVMRNESNGFSLVGSNPESSTVPGNREQLVFECVGTPRRAVLSAYYMPEEPHLLRASMRAVSPAVFGSQVTAVTLAAFASQAPRVEDRYTAIEMRPADLYRPVRAADAHHVSASVVVTPRVVDLLRRADILTFSFTQALGASGDVSVTFADGRAQALNFIANCR
jgi:hypothetical protein